MARIVFGKVATKPGDAVSDTAAAAESGPGSLVFIISATATGASQVSSGSLASVATAYVGYKVFVMGLKTATRSVVGFRTSSDGITYAASDTAYSYCGFGNTATDATTTNDTTASATSMIYLTASGGQGLLATTVAGSLSAEINIMNINATSTRAFPTTTSAIVWQGVAEMAGQQVWGRRKEAVPVFGVLLVNEGGGIFIDGRMDVYGIRAQ